MKTEIEWTPANDLPTFNGKILIAHKFGVSEGFFFKGKYVKMLDHETEFPDVTYWANIPKHPNHK